MSWVRSASFPRLETGAISCMYVFTTDSAPPTPIAYRVFHAISGQKLLENAISQMKPPREQRRQDEYRAAAELVGDQPEAVLADQDPDAGVEDEEQVELEGG